MEVLKKNLEKKGALGKEAQIFLENIEVDSSGCVREWRQHAFIIFLYDELFSACCIVLELCTFYHGGAYWMCRLI